jgi:hypothetical protein
VVCVKGAMGGVYAHRCVNLNHTGNWGHNFSWKPPTVPSGPRAWGHKRNIEICGWGVTLRHICEPDNIKVLCFESLRIWLLCLLVTARATAYKLL